MAVEVTPLQEHHLEGAAALLAARYRALRLLLPELSPAYEEPAPYLVPLCKLITRSPGVAAVRDGVVCGFMTAFALPDFLGKRCAYSPEWASATDGTDDRRLYEEMYAHLSAQWVADGCHLHAFTVMASAAEAITALQWSGFGLINVDAVRDLAPIEGAASAVTIRQADMSDLPAVIELAQALDRHIAAPPVFWPHGERDRSQWLSQPGSAVWLAFDRDLCVGMLRLQAGNPEVLLFLEDGGTAHIGAVITTVPARRGGIATALLNQALQWARAHGCQRCHVDFETANHIAARFWLKRFQPVAYSLSRWIPGVATAPQ